MFVGVAAFITQNIIYSLFVITSVALGISDSFLKELFLYFLILLVISPILYFTFAQKLRYREEGAVDSRTLTLLVFIAGIVDTVFKFYMIDHGLGMEAGGVFIVWKGFSMLTCIFILCVQFGLLRQKSLAAQKEQLEQLLYQQQKQFELTRENIDLINIKCHDLKHWLLEQNHNNFEQEAKEINKALTIYDSTIRTGNEVLDTLLTEKKFRCEYNRITMSCIIDAKNLNALNTGEICSLFGNIIDNAIEASSQIEDNSKRTISLIVRSIGNLLSIHEENYYIGNLCLSENNLETTKQDKNFHGFGMQSIRLIVESHRGSLSINAERGVFNINILIPL